ncbi:GNAT family N-acetyltransferase [Streptomyces sp. PT19]|uniref:GNAT family N-acetyltransferase n=1 Tax=Streptomyces sp. PT19 TaxID=3452239 RepID=UPI003F7D68D5
MNTAPTPDTYPLTRRADDDANESWLLLHNGDLLIAFAAIIDRGYELWITDIAVHPDYRGRGLASRLLNSVIHENSGSDIALSACAMDLQEWPKDAGGLPTEALAAWYTRHGFRSDPDENAEARMVRIA